MILTPFQGVKSCIPSNKLQKIMHSAANSAGYDQAIRSRVRFFIQLNRLILTTATKHFRI